MKLYGDNAPLPYKDICLSPHDSEARSTLLFTKPTSSHKNQRRNYHVKLDSAKYQMDRTLIPFRGDPNAVANGTFIVPSQYEVDKQTAIVTAVVLSIVFTIALASLGYYLWRKHNMTKKLREMKGDTSLGDGTIRDRYGTIIGFTE
ncbi:hypothetical protein G7046_g8069 [Stylonectria norvegica]|nr:hypothetical protein G7046_g8069 [Stylonectria norvegica]